MTNEIKAAIDIVKRNALCIGYPRELQDALKILVSLAQDYLKVAGMMPKERTPFNPSHVEYEDGEIEGYNQALHDCIFALQQKLSVEKLSEITSPFLEEIFPKGECKERGKAILLHAQMLIAIREAIIGGSNC